MSNRGFVDPTVLLFIAGLLIGYFAAQVEIQREGCPTSHQAGCLFVVEP